MKPRTAILLAILLIPIVAFSDTVRRVSPEEATSHLTDRVAPVYPQMAVVANIQGTVVLRITIAESGTVTGVNVVSGHPILIQAAIDAVKKWRYKPFLVENKPVAVQTIVTVPFLPDNAKIKKEVETSDRYFTAMELCQKQLDDHQPELAEATCKRAIALSSELTPNRTTERANAFEQTGHSLYMQSKFAEALEDYQQELRTKKDWGTDNADFAAAQHHVANGLWHTGRMAEARPLYEKSERTYKKAGKNTKSALMKDEYARQLKLVLLDHAAMLRQTGETSNAELLEKEAASIVFAAGVRDK